MKHGRAAFASKSFINRFCRHYDVHDYFTALLYLTPVFKFKRLSNSDSENYYFIGKSDSLITSSLIKWSNGSFPSSIDGISHDKLNVKNIGFNVKNITVKLSLFIYIFCTYMT